jgi:hypothetical protein
MTVNEQQIIMEYGKKYKGKILLPSSKIYGKCKNVKLAGGLSRLIVRKVKPYMLKIEK